MELLHKLVRYKAWADDVFYASLAQLPPHELTAPRPILFGSMLRTMNHIYAMDTVWQAHLEGRPHGLKTRSPKECPPFEELRDQQKAIDAWFVRYADSLAPSRVDEVVGFTFIGGGPGSLTRGEILLHVVNHPSYHRGQVADIMYTIGTQPPTTDFPVFCRDALVRA